jgi:chromosome segregation ATPase
MRQQKSRKSTTDINTSREGEKEKTKKEIVRESIRAQIMSKRNLKEAANVQDVGVDTTQTFENLWGGEGEGRKNPEGLGTFFNEQTAPRKSESTDLKSVGARSQHTMTTQETSVLGDGVKRKTKLDKIKELQAKCDRYKKEWIVVTKGKKQCRKELEFNKLEVISLTKEIETHLTETAILRKNLSESLQTLDKTQEEQRHERNECSTTAKELAQARIDHAKSLNESRELRAQLDKLEESLSEKDRRIGNLAEDLQVSKEKAEDLDADIAFAENEILKLEDDIHKLEEELIAYRTAAEKDEQNGNSENIRKARDQMEQKLHEERERRLEHKQQKLEEKIHQFEEEREKYLEKEKERDLELAEQQHQESEKQKEREQERQRTDGEINQRLKELEDDNTMLQGRLKSGQLDTSVKIKKKEEAIATLQKELADVKKQLSERDADPNGMVALEKEVETAKAQAAMTRDDLEEAQKHNGMLEEEVEDLQAACNDLRTETSSLQKEFAAVKKESETWKKKADEWQAKSGEWSDKAFQWKDKAERWENKAKELDPDANGEPSTAPAKPDPQALFLQAAFEKKRANTAAAGGGWNVLGGLFNKASEDDDEANVCVQELEEENNKQAEIIKNLRSEMVKMQTMFKEEAYSNQQRMQLLQKEREAVDLKNTGLMKELELARKLESFATQEIM